MGETKIAAKPIGSMSLLSRSTEISQIGPSGNISSLGVGDSMTNQEFIVRWETVMVNGENKGNEEVYTTTYTHIPPLAQEIIDNVDVSPTFRDPLRHLRLEIDKSGHHEDVPNTSRYYESRKHETERGRPSYLGANRPQKRFLHTPPNRYLPIPPLVRTPYFYAYGRCPVCAGNMSPSQFFARQRGASITNGKPLETVKKYTKNGPLDHLEDKSKVRVDDLSRRVSVRHLKFYVTEVMKSLKSHLYLQQEGKEDAKSGRRGSTFQADRVYNDSFSIPTFASASQLNPQSKPHKAGMRQAIRADLSHFTRMYQLKPRVDDLDDALPGSLILISKIKDYDCHIPLMNVDTEAMRELYTATILRDHLLSRLYHRRNFRNLPPDMKYLQRVNFLEFRQATSWVTVDSDTDLDRQFRVVTTQNSKSILDEMANQFYECDFAELHAFTNWLDSAKADETLLQLQTVKEITKFCVLLGEELQQSNLGIEGASRMELLIVLATAVNNYNLRHCLWGQARCWLDPLIGGLFSPSRCVREESCYTLAYMFSIDSLVEDIRHLLSFDIPYDVTWSIFRAVDQFPDTFMTYFLALGYLVEGCPTISVLNCIMERGPISAHPLMQKRWPLFVYYAIKHWNKMYLSVDPIYPTFLMEKMTLTSMVPLTRKAAKMALVALAKKFDKPVGAVTHFDPMWLRQEEE